ncbi:MAG: glycosyltransferase [Gemmataceae bacterium]
MNLHPWHENKPPAIRHEPVSVAFVGRDPSQPVADMLRPWSEFFRAHHPRHELLLFDDGATLGESQVASVPAVRVIHHPRPLGIGGALQTAILAAQHPLLLIVRVDRRFDPAQAYRLFNSIDHGDLIVGHRIVGRVPYALRATDGVRSWMSRVFLGNFLEPRSSWLGWSAWRREGAYRWIFGVPISDAESGIFLARRAVFDRIPIQSNSAFSFVEAIAKANHLGAMLGEEPIRWAPADAEAPPSAPGEKRTLFGHPLFRTAQAHDLPSKQPATEK